ncbi:MAG: prepilin-type N-terminal cleavage/methylation domain-containing protein [Parcubacteria group bacterium]|jgi:type II secretory pathway pseudopilin PulG
MKKQKTKNKIRPAFTLIEALIFLFIFSIVTVTFYRSYSLGTQYIINSKNRLAALALANEKMEIVRNLAFDDIAHTTGDPAGNLHESEDIVRNGASFNVLTQIKNEDDPFDGTLGGSPNDVDFIDYKYVKITVSWNNGQYKVSMNSRFVPAGVEQPTANKGVLVINVSSDKGGGIIPQSLVRIQNSDTGLDETHSTDNYGRLMMVGLSESIKKYVITVTKSGYETIASLPPYPDTSYNPIPENASVVAGGLNTINIYQNELSDLSIKTKDYKGDSVPDIDFHLIGGRQIGTEYNADPMAPAVPKYSTDADYTTNSSGEKNFSSIDPGNYTFTLNDSDYEVVGYDPVSPAVLAPGGSLDMNVKVSRKDVAALLVTISRADDLSLLEGASVRLTNGSGYDKTAVTSKDGLAFFPRSDDVSFTDGDYTLAVTADGLVDYSESVTINENELKEKTVELDLQT